MLLLVLALAAADAAAPTVTPEDCAVYAAMNRAYDRPGGIFAFPVTQATMGGAYTPVTARPHPMMLAPSSQELAELRAAPTRAGLALQCDWKALDMPTPRFEPVYRALDPCARRDYVPIEAPDHCYGSHTVMPRVTLSAPAYTANHDYAWVQREWGDRRRARAIETCIVGHDRGGTWFPVVCSETMEQS